MEKKDNLRYSAIFGIGGALLGAVLCLLPSYLPSKMYQKLLPLILLLAPQVITYFYRRCRGPKKLAFMLIATGLCTLIVSILSPIISLTRGHGAIQILLDPDYWAAAWQMQILFSVVALIGLDLCGHSIRLHVAEPSQIPRIAAQKYAGGMLYNKIPYALPHRAVPWKFRVGERLTVDGSTLRRAHPLKGDDVFPVWKVAGVFLGGCTGSNVLYDKEFHVLAKFAWSMDGADLLARYLVQHDIPFDNAPPVLAAMLTPEIPEEDQP